MYVLLTRSAENSGHVGVRCLRTIPTTDGQRVYLTQPVSMRHTHRVHDGSREGSSPRSNRLGLPIRLQKDHVVHTCNMTTWQFNKRRLTLHLSTQLFPIKKCTGICIHFVILCNYARGKMRCSWLRWMAVVTLNFLYGEVDAIEISPGNDSHYHHYYCCCHCCINRYTHE